METIVIVASCQSYRTGDFITAARAQRLGVVIATDAPSPFDSDADRTIEVDLADPEAAASAIVTAVPDAAAIIAVDDQGVNVVALASRTLGLQTNSRSAIEATRNKLAMRRRLEAADIAQPSFASVLPGEIESASLGIGLPVVVKPTSLSASRGVIKVDSRDRLAAVETRVRAILVSAGHDHSEPLIVEQYIDGDEMVVEGIMVRGALEVLALIDKPVPLTGPYFEETMFISPSQQPEVVRLRVVETVRTAIQAMGLTTGPVHAEVRIDPNGQVYVIEIAARSIGGLCGRSLSFGLLAEPLESVVIRGALGFEGQFDTISKPATGVLMLPIPATGTLTNVEGIEGALAVGGIESIDITIPIGKAVKTLPEGDRYLGFVFAAGLTPRDVEIALAEAAARIDVTIDGESVASAGQADAIGLGR